MSDYAPGRHPNSLANLQPHKPGFQPDPAQVSAAGKAGGAVRRKRRLIKDALQAILAAGVTDEAIREKLAEAGLDDTYADAIALAMSAKAVTGDVDAARFVRDSSGEKPAQGVELGNLDDKPFQAIDLGALSDADLQRMIADRQG